MINTCASYQNYAFDGEVINNGGQDGTLGDISRIFFAMRWDLEICPNDYWWKPDGQGKVDDYTSSPAGKYLVEPSVYDDCVKGLTEAVNQCEYSYRSCFPYLGTFTNTWWRL